MQFLYPVPPGSVVIQSFAAHVHRAEVNGWQHYNGGIDWSVPTGTPIPAAQAGSVTQVMNDAAGYGVCVLIQHDEGYETLYAHLMDASVVVDQTVEAGDIIGRSDSTGNATEPHLHFEVRLNERTIDPAPLLVASLAAAESSRDIEPLDMVQLPGKAPRRWPRLPRLQVVALVGLNIYQQPDLKTPVVGYLPCQAEFEALRKIDQGDDTWLQIGHNQFVLLEHNQEMPAAWI